MESQSADAAPYMRDRFGCCVRNWIAQQHRDLDQLLGAVCTDSGDVEKLRSLAGKNIQHYLEAQSQLAQHHAPSFFCPSWCTSFENSFLWIGGCRCDSSLPKCNCAMAIIRLGAVGFGPLIATKTCFRCRVISIEKGEVERSFSRRLALAIRLGCSISGSGLNAQLAGEGRRGDDSSNGSGDNLGEISAWQLKSINELHMKTVRMEEKLSSMQEEIADDSLALIVKRKGRVVEESESVERVMKGHALSLARVLTEVDELRLATLRELVEEILTPLQAVEFLVNMKKLHFSIHEWGKRRDSVLGKV